MSKITTLGCCAMSYVAILETGVPPAGLDATYGTYADMFAKKLHEPDRAFRVFKTLDGELPDMNEDFRGVVITGSPAGVYESDPWISALINWLKALRADVPVVGICFGHQVMAQAWGGHVEKSHKGWGVGLHEYTIHDGDIWSTLTDGAHRAIKVAVTHQDQVVRKPDTAIVLAGSEFTPHGALYYTDRKAISFQCHPEFCADFAGDLLKSRRGVRITEELVDTALISLEEQGHSQDILKLISRFLA